MTSDEIDSSSADRRILDAIYGRMRDGYAFESMDALVARLFRQRIAMSVSRWKDYAADVLLKHPIRKLLHCDPFTYRAFSKPRGYAGDAVMIDMIYSAENGFEAQDLRDKAISHYTIDGTSPRAVRNRRRLLARLIDETVCQRSDARILSLAAGHMRELELTKAVSGAYRGEIVALDQDDESLAVIERDYAWHGVRSLHAPIKRLFTGKLGLHGFDFVYAAGLFDYLPQPVAKALCERMFEMLSPGGRMLVANFVPNIPDVGYMESFMDWHLIYRNEADMRDLFSGIPREQLAGIDLSFDGTQNIAYLTINARG